MFADVKYGESLHQKEKRSKKFKPMEPMSGAGKGGRLGASATQGFVQTLFSYVFLQRAGRKVLITNLGRLSNTRMSVFPFVPKGFVLMNPSPEKPCSSMQTRRIRRRSDRMHWPDLFLLHSVTIISCNVKGKVEGHVIL